MQRAHMLISRHVQALCQRQSSAGRGLPAASTVTAGPASLRGRVHDVCSFVTSRLRLLSSCNGACLLLCAGTTRWLQKLEACMVAAAEAAAQIRVSRRVCVITASPLRQSRRNGPHRICLQISLHVHRRGINNSEGQRAFRRRARINACALTLTTEYVVRLGRILFGNRVEHQFSAGQFADIAAAHVAHRHAVTCRRDALLPGGRQRGVAQLL